LIRQNFDVLVFAPNYDEKIAKDIYNLGAKPVHYSLSRAGANIIEELISIVSIAEFMRREKPDILFCFQIKPAIYGSISAIVNRINKVFIMI